MSTGRWPVVFGIAAMALGAPSPGIAQQTAPEAPAVARAATAPLAPAVRFDATPAREVAERLTRASGTIVVVDKTTVNAPVTLALPAGPLETTLAQVAAALPKGAVVKKVMLPAPPTRGALPDGDQVAAIAAAQDALYGSSAGPSAAGESGVNILGKRLPTERAAPAVAALDLKPVYLLTNPNVANDPVQKMNAAQVELLRTLMNMTPEQQNTLANQQFDMLLNMDPAIRQQLFAQQAQMGKTILQRIQNMPESQRTQFLAEMRNAFGAIAPGTQGGGGSAPAEPQP